MKKIWFLVSILLLFSIQTVFAAEFVLKSPQLTEGGRLSEKQVYKGFGCDGENISPELTWENAPEKTKSFAVTVYDPDAPTGSGWWHWLIFNIPAKVNRLPENAGNPGSGLAPEKSIQSRTDYGKPGFGGACPPEGDPPHRYIFKVYALDVESIPLNADAPAAMVGYFLNQHALATDTITAIYSRSPEKEGKKSDMGMDESLLEKGAFSWFELMTTDVGEAKSFYGEILGWNYEDYPVDGKIYTLIKVGNRPVGGIMGRPEQAEGMPPTWGIYVTVDDVDETVKKVKELGGKILLPPMNIKDVGRFSVIQDPQGAWISVITYEQKQD